MLPVWGHQALPEGLQVYLSDFQVEPCLGSQGQTTWPGTYSQWGCELDVIQGPFSFSYSCVLVLFWNIALGEPQGAFDKGEKCLRVYQAVLFFVLIFIPEILERYIHGWCRTVKKDVGLEQSQGGGFLQRIPLLKTENTHIIVVQICFCTFKSWIPNCAIALEHFSLGVESSSYDL